MMFGLKQETIVAIFFGCVTVVGTVGFTAYTSLRDSSTHTVLTDNAMAQVMQRLDRIEAGVNGIPLYVQRLTQLEDGRKDQLAYNGAIDSRVSVIHDDVEYLKTVVGDVKRASGIPLRK